MLRGMDYGAHGPLDRLDMVRLNTLLSSQMPILLFEKELMETDV